MLLIGHPLLNAPLNEFLNLQSVPVNSECGEELAMVNKNNSLHHSTHYRVPPFTTSPLTTD